MELFLLFDKKLLGITINNIKISFGKKYLALAIEMVKCMGMEHKEGF